MTAWKRVHGFHVADGEALHLLIAGLSWRCHGLCRPFFAAQNEPPPRGHAPPVARKHAFST